MKTTLFVLLSLSTVAVQAQRGDFTYDRLLERNDRNNDGVVARDEIPWNPQLFDRIDQDQDGTATREEFEAGMKKWNNRTRTESLPGKQVRRRLPEGITVHRDLEYAVEDGESLQLDLYLPAAMDPAPPLMVWIHGGGWRNGDKANVNPAILRLSGEGYAVASINYRLKDLSIHPKNIHDCKGAVRWLRAHAGTYGYDPERVAVGGGSAGGHLSLLLGLSSGVQELEGTVGGHGDQSTAVKAIVDLYGPSELKMMAATQKRFSSAHDFDSGQLASASPLVHLTPDDPPVLIFHGDQDNTVPVEQSMLLHKRYQEADLVSELHILEGAGHGGMVFSDDERYQLIKAFLDRHVAK